MTCNILNTCFFLTLGPTPSKKDVAFSRAKCQSRKHKASKQEEVPEVNKSDPWKGIFYQKGRLQPWSRPRRRGPRASAAVPQP